MENNIKIINESELTFTNIGNEKYRTYVFDDNFSVKIEEPLYLNVSKSGGHRILDSKNISHYIPSGWRHLYWEVFETKPNFVK